MNNNFPSWLKIPLIFLISFIVIELCLKNSDIPAFIENPIVLLIHLVILTCIITLEYIHVSLKNIEKLFSDKLNKKIETEKNDTNWFKKIIKKLSNLKSVKDEKLIILNHDYDGIKELDNSLPPWWLYGFYLTILFAIVYLLNFHVFSGPNQLEEMNIEYEIAETEINNYLENNTSEINLDSLVLLTSNEDLDQGKSLFTSNCAVCHNSDGGGGIGPNLTDQYWILGGGLKNVYNTISEGGREGKGMIPWKQSLSKSEISKISSYIISLKNTNPENPKIAEGDVWAG